MILFIFIIIPLLLYLLRVIFVRLLIIVHCRLFSLLLLSIIIDTIHPPSLRIRSNLLITLLIGVVEILLLWRVVQLRLEEGRGTLGCVAGAWVLELGIGRGEGV
jgi:hypothetical protein